MRSKISLALQRISSKLRSLLPSWLLDAFRPLYHRVLEALGGFRGIHWTINGVPCRVLAKYRHMGTVYEPELSSYLSKRVQTGQSFWDVGAYVGYYVLQVAHWNGPNGKVHAFEANPLVAQDLSAHVRINQLADRVTVVSAAVSDHCGSTEFFTAGHDGMGRLNAPPEALGNRVRPVQVQLVTLDEYAKQTGEFPDWLLIDVEGFELQVLRGASDILARGKGKLGIVMEMHPQFWDNAGTTRESFQLALSELGLQVVALTGQKDPLVEYGQVALTWKS